MSWNTSSDGSAEADRVNIFLHNEAVRWAGPDRVLPVTIVTGALGAGKTTLMHHILGNKRNLRIAAAVNDFAAINIDSESIKRRADDTGVVELTNGCICCSKSSDLVAAVWDMLQEADAGNIDYLLIETSGVSDPVATIKPLEAEYGKMYRVRLDSVIYVLDADDISAKLDAQDADAVAVTNQLRCADVVLLNKVDLIEPEQLAAVHAKLVETVPDLQVLECSFGNVPLSAILEIHETGRGESQAGVVTHETAETRLLVSQSEQKSLRTGKLPKDLSPSSVTHDDEFAPMVFESESPLSLADFQDFLGPKLPAGILRIKGWLYFESDGPGLSWTFHYSGRRRYECIPDAGSGAARMVRIVLIGQGFDTAAVLTQLEGCVRHVKGAAPLPSTNGGAHQHDHDGDDGSDHDHTATGCIPHSHGADGHGHEHGHVHHEAAAGATAVAFNSLGEAGATAFSEAKAIVAVDDRFEVLSEGSLSTDTDLLFRLTAVEHLGVSMEEMVTRHNIDFDKVQRDVCARINYTNGGSFLTFVNVAGVGLHLRFATGGQLKLKENWPVISAAADVIIKTAFEHVLACRCGW